ncbi:MAG: type II toxin-antitoxin system RelE/ParE family toxin [Clostridiales bacterium]|nr:type II toxin-antitoxin system RelE/ParE family toxin [Clostridiales bacterium]
MDKYRIRITRQARDHLREIHRYITYELLSPAAAKNTLDAIRREMEALCSMPQDPPHARTAMVRSGRAQGPCEELLHLLLDRRREPHCSDHRCDLCAAGSVRPTGTDQNGMIQVLYANIRPRRQTTARPLYRPALLSAAPAHPSIPSKQNSSFMGFAASMVYSGSGMAPQLLSPATPICLRPTRSTV